MFRDREDENAPVGVVETTILKTAANGDGLVGGDPVVNEVCIVFGKGVNVGL